MDRVTYIFPDELNRLGRLALDEAGRPGFLFASSIEIVDARERLKQGELRELWHFSFVAPNHHIAIPFRAGDDEGTMLDRLVRALQAREEAERAR